MGCMGEGREETGGYSIYEWLISSDPLDGGETITTNQNVNLKYSTDSDDDDSNW